MKKFLVAVSLMTAVVLLCATFSQAAAQPKVTFKVRGIPGSGLLELDVGESHTFEIQIKSSEPFVLAIALTNQYYPGRGIYWHGGDMASQGTEAVLYLTMTGKASTADLFAVCDWPEPGDCWPEGVAPVTVAVGVRFAGGEVVGEQYPFAVLVP
jgi:hypothetical protein